MLITYTFTVEPALLTTYYSRKKFDNVVETVLETKNVKGRKTEFPDVKSE